MEINKKVTKRSPTWVKVKELQLAKREEKLNELLIKRKNQRHDN